MIRLKVTDDGVNIPKHLLGGAGEVEVTRLEDEILVRLMLDKKPVSVNDPILEMGQSPVTCGVFDASENLDKHLY